MKIIKVILIIVFFIEGIFLLSKFQVLTNPVSSLAEKVIRKCRTSDFRNLCYEDEIPKLMKSLSMEDTFSVTQVVQGKDSDFPYCHVLGHKLASIETKKDPDKWREAIARCPSGVCSNGCVHGAFQEKYKDEVLSGQSFSDAKKELENLCEASQSFKITGLTQGSCYHALGHLLMYVTNADIDKSVNTCDEIAKKKDGRDFSGLCYDGAFMQIFQPLDTDDKSLVKNIAPTAKNAYEFCQKYTGEKKVSCWTESWPLFLTQISKGSGLIDFCSRLDTKGKNECFTDMFYIMPIQFRFNMNAINNYCDEFPQTLQSKCFSMTASRILEIDSRNVKRTVDYCDSLSGVNKNACFERITTDAKFDFDTESPEYSQICSLVPEPWQTKCNQSNK